MNNEQFTEQDSVNLIRSMLERTQHQVSDNGFFYLLWGWLVFSAAILNYLGWLLLGPVELVAIPWMILMPLGGIISAIYGARIGKKNKAVVTYTQELLNRVMIAYLISLFIVLFFGILFIGWEKTYPFIMVIYGIWLFVSGSALRFSWLVWGGVFVWVCAVICFFVLAPHQLLVISVAVLVGYIIPGHLLRRHFRKQHGTV